MKFKKLNKDLVKRKELYSNELIKYVQYKILFKFWILKKNYQFFFLKKKQKINCYYTQINNICILTGHTRLINKVAKISKFKLKNLINKGYLFGIKPHCW